MTKLQKKEKMLEYLFMFFFENKNNNPETLMEVAKWWILEQKLDHFEKAVKIMKCLTEEI
jgi:hypothetical protein